MIEVTFNGVELTQYITVLDGFTLWGGADFDPQYTENSILDGSEFSYMRKKHKTIPVPFYVKYENSLGYDYLQQVLNVKEPKELTFSIYPNRVFYAIPSGDLDFDEVRLNGKGTITFIVVDGLAHSKSTRTFEFTENEQGTLEAEIENAGSEPVTVDYEIKLKKESGFVGIVSEYGAMQYGKIDELDGYIDQKNVILHENKNGDFDEWVDGTVNYENSQKIINTKMGADKAYGGRLGILPAFSTSGTSGAYQYGAIKELELSETAQNWYIWARAWFETGLDGQTGAWCLSVIDENNHFIAGMAIEKNDTIGNTAQIRFLVGDGAGGSRVVDPTFSFTPSCWFPPNPYSSEGRQENKDANMFDILKDSETIGFYWYGSRFNVKEPRLKNTKAKKVQFFVGQYAGRNTTDRIVTLHSLNYFRFEKLHVDYWKDIPNRYRAGSTIKIDGANGQFFVNNQRKQEDEILGTAYFKVPPGKTKVRLLVSSFAEVESATATIEEAYI